MSACEMQEEQFPPSGMSNSRYQSGPPTSLQRLAYLRVQDSLLAPHHGTNLVLSWKPPNTRSCLFQATMR